MKDIEHCNKILINMKEQYRKDVKAFVKAT
jgi:hypothetical protein